MKSLLKIFKLVPAKNFAPDVLEALLRSLDCSFKYFLQEQTSTLRQSPEILQALNARLKVRRTQKQLQGETQ